MVQVKNYMAVPGMYSKQPSKENLLKSFSSEQVLDVVRNACLEFYGVKLEKFHYVRTSKHTQGRTLGLSSNDIACAQMFCYIVKRKLLPTLGLRYISQYIRKTSSEHTLVLHRIKQYQNLLDTYEFERMVCEKVLETILDRLNALWLKTIKPLPNDTDQIHPFENS